MGIVVWSRGVEVERLAREEKEGWRQMSKIQELANNTPLHHHNVSQPSDCFSLEWEIAPWLSCTVLKSHLEHYSICVEGSSHSQNVSKHNCSLHKINGRRKQHTVALQLLLRWNLLNNSCYSFEFLRCDCSFLGTHINSITLCVANIGWLSHHLNVDY